jgi:hypothetical protein
MPVQATMPNPCAGVPNNPWCPFNPLAPLASRSQVERPDARVPAAVQLASD